MRPASCSACVPRIATAIARSHMRMRAQLPMFTRSDTAPMVQKLVRFATAPNTKASAKPAHATTAAMCDAPPLTIPPGVSRHSVAPPIGDSPWVSSWRRPVSRRIGERGGAEALAPEAAGIAGTARTPLAVRVVARHRHRVVHAELAAAAHDLGLRHVHDRRLDRDGRALDRALGREVREALEGGDELGTAIGIAGVIHRVRPGED